jgi:2-amino-4-hydroxy-6-hydroxymethyldihydropteridine diphosphokinase
LRSSELVLPHPEMQQRAFVLVPLLELEPSFEIPGVGPAADCLEDIGASEAAAVVPLPSTSNENRS